ncbi:20191_t:CDS:1 [Racocetra fulgida]|uniref:20191_t:CDS:1 n=1 Tax=Racocetra fulgida TaxID=60492 RepID=A0A9N8VDB6_9GLOM|nr:20191_t:CDS:1 [Racocetra fulgida]
MSKHKLPKQKMSKQQETDCNMGAIVKFIPDYNLDELWGIIIFSEVSLKGNPQKQTKIDGTFTTPIGFEGLKTIDGEYIYTIELFNGDKKVYDLTEPIFNGAAIHGNESKIANLTICGQNSIIGKTVVIKRDEEEIATANIAGLGTFNEI